MYTQASQGQIQICLDSPKPDIQYITQKLTVFALLLSSEVISFSQNRNLAVRV